MIPAKGIKHRAGLISCQSTTPFVRQTFKICIPRKTNQYGLFKRKTYQLLGLPAKGWVKKSTRPV